MKKKLFPIVLCVFVLVSLMVGCSNISQDEYDSLVAEKEALQEKYDNLQEEYDKMKADVEPYLALSKAEAEAKAKQEEEALAAQKAAEEEAARAAEAEAAAKKEAEEKQGYETGITYDQLARTPDEYKEKKVKFKGEVIQLIENEGNDTVQIRLAVNGDYDTVIFGEYDRDIVTSRVLENDKITIFGKSAGLISYESTIGGTITIPSVWIEKIEQ